MSRAITVGRVSTADQSESNPAPSMGGVADSARSSLRPNPSTLQARVIVDELVRGGVTDVVLCPGSRNAPLSFAVHAADARGDLRLHVRIDERSAGFLAVGMAAATRRPVAVIMTSGTAVANLSPAVFEANYARVPLVVISANRPYELLGSGANQTVEQFGIFGTQVRAAISLGLAEPGLDRNSQWRSAVCRVLAAARGARSGNAGPVQFDVPLREPLVLDDPAPTAAQGRHRPRCRVGPPARNCRPQCCVCSSRRATP
ncbi:hypothetical protein GCM10023147_43590 [Tsukamurella soli]|uniref:Thiamine pyrophosphate enzyme N-terminal TPP-binding domain-containing protein n=1 Tax=Tsukamurella soli TaxID=644556 RepID=A0ABP8K9D0_9ACTN